MSATPATRMMSTTITRRRFTVADYERMAEAGILDEDDRVELIAGEIAERSPIGIGHVACVIALTDALSRYVGRDAVVSVQNPIRLSDESAPQPDVAVLRRHSYHDRLPIAADVLLVIEVADSSLAYDRGIKLPLYAAGIPEAWLVDLAASQIKRHTTPSAAGYQLIARAGRGDTLASTMIPTLEIPVDTVLGPEQHEER